MSDLLHIGPYRVNGRIGEGGMGAVYEAFHRDSGERHAVKTLRADGGGIGIHGIRALRREVQVLAEIDHPHIVNVVDFDLDADLPWFAMEYIDGRPLSEWHRTPAETISTADTILEVADRTTVDDWDSFQAAIAEARTKTFQVPAQLRQDAPKPAPPSDWTPDAELRTKLSWFGQLARALEFLHGLQIVHGDVKPDNVLVRSDGVAVLVDFGLVSRMERRVTRSALERMRTRAQTLEYAAPERHLTAEYDARADLYALGCMLYELFAGLPPFVGPPTAVAIAHVVEQPPSLTEIDHPPPPAIWRLIQRLLQKEPIERTAYAREICAVLEDHSIPTTAPGAPLPPALPYLYQPRLVGFDAQIEIARQAIKAPNESPFLGIVGPGGAGKSRFALQATYDALHAGYHVRVIEGDGDEQLPFSAFRPVTAELADRAAAGLWEPGAEAVWLSTLEPRLKPYLSGQQRDTLAAVENTEISDAVNAVARALVDAMRRSSGSKPVLLVVESFDELGPGSRRVLDEVSKRARSEPWLVLATVPSTDDLDVEDCRPILLPSLGFAEVEQVTAQMLGAHELDDSVVRQLQQTTGGRPGHLVELVHSLLDHQLIEQDERGRWQGIDGASLAQALGMLPDEKWADMVDRRIELVSEHPRRIGSLAAVLGRRFQLAHLVALAGEETADVVLAASDLIRLEFVREVDFVGAGRNAGLLEFANVATHEAFYDRLDEDDRRSLHCTVAKLFAEQHEDPVAVARHWERGGDARKAHDAWLDAAAHAKRRFAHELRAECLEGAVRVADWLDDERREDLLTMALDAISGVAPTARVRKEARALLDGATRPQNRVLLLRRLIKHALMESRVDDVLEHLPELQELAKSPHAELSVSARVALCSIAEARDELELALRHAEQAVEVADQSGSATLRDEASSKVGSVLFRMGRLVESRPWQERALRHARETDEPVRVHRAAGNLAAVLMSTGYHRLGRTNAAEVAAFQRRAQLLWPLLINVWNIAVADIELGDFRSASSKIAEMKELRERLALDDDDSPYLRLEARLLGHLGRFERALRLSDESLGLARTDRARTMALIGHSEVLMAAGRYREALEALPDSFPDELDFRAATRGHQRRANLASRTEDFERAERELDVAAELVRDREFHLTAQVRTERGRLRRRQGRLEEAEALLAESLRWFDRQDAHYDATLTRLELARCRTAAGRDLQLSLIEPIQTYVASQPFSADAAIRRQLHTLRT